MDKVKTYVVDIDNTICTQTYGDYSKAKKILNWKSNIKFDNGLKRTINFYKGKNK